MKKISQDDAKKVLSEVMHPEIKYNLVGFFENCESFSTIFVTFFLIESPISSDVRKERKTGEYPLLSIKYAAIGLSNPPESKDINFFILLIPYL